MPGDHVIVTGVFLPFLKTGFNARLGPALSSETYLDAHVRIEFNFTIIQNFLHMNKLIFHLISENSMFQ